MSHPLATSRTALLSLSNFLPMLLQHLYNVMRQTVLDLTMSRDRLAYLGCWVLIPVMIRAVADEHAPHFLNGSNQLSALHATSNSPTLRTHGIKPDVSSL